MVSNRSDQFVSGSGRADGDSADAAVAEKVAGYDQLHRSHQLNPCVTPAVEANYEHVIGDAATAAEHADKDASAAIGADGNQLPCSNQRLRDAIVAADGAVADAVVSPDLRNAKWGGREHRMYCCREPMPDCWSNEEVWDDIAIYFLKIIFEELKATRDLQLVRRTFVAFLFEFGDYVVKEYDKRLEDFLDEALDLLENPRAEGEAMQRWAYKNLRPSAGQNSTDE